MVTPIVKIHDGVMVVRDDLFPGGTKARFFPLLFKRKGAEAVYASPAEGGAQTALAAAAKATGGRATIFVAKRAKPHPRTLMAKRLGAKIVEVSPGYLTVVQSRARAYAAESGAFLIPFGAALLAAEEVITRAAVATGRAPDEVWCAGGSGMLCRALRKAWPQAERHIVQVGRALTNFDVMGAAIHIFPLPYATAFKEKPPFPSDPHYDAKAWSVCLREKGRGRVLFWNVTGPAIP